MSASPSNSIRPANTPTLPALFLRLRACLIAEVWGGFSPEAMRYLGELAQARNDGIDIERSSATWSTSSFTSYHGQLLSLAVQWGVAIEIERAIMAKAKF